MQKHRFNIFPKADPEDFAAIVADMKEHGYDTTQPVVVYQNKILDGWNRWLASQDAGVTANTRQFLGSDEEALTFTLRTNKRRNMTSSQRGAYGAEAEEIYAEIAATVEESRRVKQIENAANQHTAQKEPSGNYLPKGKNPDENKAATKTAEIFNTNRTYISDARKLKKESPEVFQKVLSGEKTIPQAKREIKEIKKEERREENRAKVADAPKAETIINAGAKFSTIMIDPPWDWGDEGDKDQLGRARPDYATMSIDQLCALPIPALSDTDCHIYLWITNRSLPKGFRLLEAWGFRYITAITWIKPHFGMGNYFRGQTEHVLFGVKGSQALKRKDVGTVFNAARGPNGHSSKPVEFYDIVESCSPGPYLEMFSRCQRKDWTAWGEGQ